MAAINIFPAASSPRSISTLVDSPDDRRSAMTSFGATSGSTTSTESQPRLPPDDSVRDDAITPTRARFNAEVMSQQKPLPTSSSFPQAAQEAIVESPAARRRPKREDSSHSRMSKDSDDVEMMDSDTETAGAEGESDGEDSVSGDGSGSKKRKSQRFYCTEFPPCNLSFTRSEHLARHIRKHTGERPFQCHCSRRFSRLDNLRQHAQTVHVNEDIPGDSLAASGIRFQRQVRAERVRPNTGGARARSGTAGSQGPGGRGHSKSLSTSSIASISSVGSSYSTRDEIRRRPPPLVMADPRARLSVESYQSSEGAYSYRPASPVEIGTPPSATYENSPQWGSTIASPSSSYSRPPGTYSTGSRTPGRRLSVPSSGNPFHITPSSFQSPGLSRPPFLTTSSHGRPSPRNSMLASPNVSITPSSHHRRESSSSILDDAWRRRTWHPDTNNYPNGASRLSNVITPSQISPANPTLPSLHPEDSSQQVRLPGIASFDPVRPPTPPIRRSASPMVVDSDPRHPVFGPGGRMPLEQRRPSINDVGLQQGLTRLDLGASAPQPNDSARRWADEVHLAVQEQARREPIRYNPPTVRFDPEPQVALPPLYPPEPVTPPPMPRGHAYTMSAPSFSHMHHAPRRHGWHDGPSTLHEGRVLETQPRVDRLEHPNMAAFQGFPARNVPQQQPPAVIQPSQPQEQAQHSQMGDSSKLNPLETLVAVATGDKPIGMAY